MLTAALSDAQRERFARILIWTHVLGLLTAIALFISHSSGRSVSLVAALFNLANIPVSNTLASIVIMGLLVWTLVRRKRAAVYAVAFFQVSGILIGLAVVRRLEPGFHLPGGPTLDTPRFITGPVFDVAAIGVACVMLWLLWWVRDLFPGHLRRGAWVALIAALAVGAALGLTVISAALGPQRLSDLPHPAASVVATTLRSFGVNSPFVRRYQVDAPDPAEDVASLVFAVSAAIALALLLRSSEATIAWSGTRELQLRELVHKYGAGDSLSYFSTRRDKSLVFDDAQTAAVAYRVIGGVSLASGDPVGDPVGWGQAIRQWRDEARYYGWIPAVLAASETGARAYLEHGFAVLTFGDEAILDVASFTTRRESMTPLRRTVNRLRRAGVTLRVERQRELSEPALQELRDRVQAWRGENRERGYSMALGRAGDPADDVLLVTALDATGTPVGLLSLVPWGPRGRSLDLMLRAPDAPNGVTEFMVTGLMERAEDLGIAEVSLNFAMFRAVYDEADRLGASVVDRVNFSVLGAFDRFFQLERLYRFNQRFQPTWRPRFLCFDSHLNLLAVAVAAGRAEGFLPDPAQLLRLGGEPQLTPEEVTAARQIVASSQVELPATARDDQTAQRIRQVYELTLAGENPYPVGVDCRLSAADLTGLVGTQRFWGRVRNTRDHGGVIFVDLTAAGTTVQLRFERDVIGATRWRTLAHAADSGDLLVVTATPGLSRSGAPVWDVHDWTLAAKSLHPIPFRSFEDPQARSRRRSTDLIVHPEQVRLLEVRSRVVTGVRRFFDDEGFTEVETPILHSVHGGASARPFRTFINAYGQDLSLRIAPELYLKRLLVAGLGGGGGIYEVGRNFRNEGADATHNPEFTSLEAYLPFADYSRMADLTEALVKRVATTVHGSASLPIGPGGALVDVSAPWPRVSVLDAVSTVVGEQVSLDTDFDRLLELCRAHHVAVRPEMGPGAVIEELYAELVESTTTLPTFYVDFPIETSPLTRAHRSIPGLVERWDLVVAGMELGTAYSELTDPLDQRHRLTVQSLKAAAGDPEAMQIDHDFLNALELGMPPTGGLGIGVDRLVMLLTGTNIRSVLTFPFVRRLN